MKAVAPSGVIFVAMIVVSTLPAAWAGSSPRAEELLAAFEDSLDRMKRAVAFDAETHLVLEGAFNRDVMPTKETITARIRRRGEWLDSFIVEKPTYVPDIPRIPVEGTRRRRRICAAGERKKYKAFDDDRPKWLVIDTADEVNDVAGVYGMLPAGRYLDGYAKGDDALFLPEAMRNGTLRLREEMEIIDGHRTYVLESESDYGKKVVWIDPEYGHCARRIVMQKTEGHLYGRKPLGTPPKPLHPRMISKEPHVALTGMEIEVRTTRIEQVDGVYVPVEARITESKSYANGQSTRKTALHRRSNIDIDPDFEKIGAFVIDVPNGTPIRFLDERGGSGVEFEWRDGNVFTRVDETFLACLEESLEGITMDKPCATKAASAYPASEPSASTGEPDKLPLLAEAGESCAQAVGSVYPHLILLGVFLGGIAVYLLLVNYRTKWGRS